MRDPGPARLGPSLLAGCTHSLQITENRAELPAALSPPSAQSRHLLFSLLMSWRLWRSRAVFLFFCFRRMWSPDFTCSLRGCMFISSGLIRQTDCVCVSLFSSQSSLCHSSATSSSFSSSFSLIDALQCLFSVTKRPRLPPCPLAFSSKT